MVKAAGRVIDDACAGTAAAATTALAARSEVRSGTAALAAAATAAAACRMVIFPAGTDVKRLVSFIAGCSAYSLFTARNVKRERRSDIKRTH